MMSISAMISYGTNANDFYDAGVDDDNFVLVTNSNRKCQVGINLQKNTSSRN